ncbi:hypothetical protein COCC4DRAFT_152935 [Bipolaris maydis ATCC 48331]|uniref:Uncharacterized protein n=2 Tax=Cochliobolus heterostrophus TaxID=5016 RepID=M2TGS8_COCH5|nr:uncharacterized protein COCC4DRAFT_152935 [Bipolaris maydis ATCC 48331]EMD85704.1 hypothetical protein COCHEDRAFT_1118098 [Bipolaris maydis C5]ENH99574.1 hypothetical protein COCC4DRAFT_152935 [Bipolaris maydis ATCC 48331]KAJ6208546.1 hypothetical protein PSV09DRAFT_1118098 [Bipolaris maydis]
MSNLSVLTQLQSTSTEPFPPVALTKPPRPVSAPCPNFSKPIAADPLPTTDSKSVGAHEVQARIQAARRSLTAAQPPTEAFQRKLDQSSDLIHPALRARSGVTPNSDRARSLKSRSKQDQSIDAVIRRLSAEIDSGQLNLARDVPPVPALPAFHSPASGRPRSYQPASSRSSVTKRRSPLSIVSSADVADSEETPCHTSEQTSTQTSRQTSRRASTSASSHDDDKPAKIRVISLESHKAGHVQQQQQPARQPSPSSSQPTISNSKPQRVKSRSPWHTISRRRILCFV